MDEFSPELETSVTTPLPPVLTNEFLLDHLDMIGNDWLGFLQRCATEFGDIVQITLPGKDFCLLNNSDYIEYVLVTNNHNFIKDSALRSAKTMYGNGLLTSEGDDWLRHRRLVQPAFHRRQIVAYGATMVDYTQRLLATWHDGQTLDLHHEMVLLSLRILAKTLFGTELPEDQSSGNPHAGIGRLFGIELAGDLALPQLNAAVYDLIGRRRASSQEHHDLLSLMINARYEDGGGLPDQQIRDEIVTLLVAGNDTTALTVSWAWYLLAQHPEIEQRLCDELNAVLGERAATADDLPRLTYTTKIIKETLRLYPPIWGFGREALHDCEIDGIRVPAGTTLFMSQWVTHRDPGYFDEPDAFQPERWTDEFVQHLPKYAYFPFGGGPRLCIGGPFGQTAATLLLVTMVQRFRLEIAPDSVVPAPLLTLQPKHGVPVIVHRR